jgi:hypothetical protein
MTRGNRSTRRKSYPKTTLFATNLTYEYTDQELKVGLYCKWPAANSLEPRYVKNIDRTSRRTNSAANREANLIICGYNGFLL